MNLDENVNISKRPNASAFHQQKLKGWKPIITTSNMYLSFFAIGIIFIVVGSVLIYYSHQITEMKMDYTNCLNSNGQPCSDVLLQMNYTYHYQSCQCKINMTIPADIKSPVFSYYGLTNFFQNHRRYVKSRDDKQLKGLNVESLNSDCQPYQYANSSIQYAPCGIIANSLFNDTFRLDYIQNDTLVTVPWTSTGIAWSSETNVRYGKPTSWVNTVKPPNWPISALARSPNAYSGDEDLLVWMRTAALPNFKKMHRKFIHESDPFLKGIPRGSYVLSINYSYPVSPFQGAKTFILSTTNILGGKNTALGIVYLSVGTIYFSLAIAFIFINAFVSRRQSEEAWYIASQNRINGCPNETFSNVDINEEVGFADGCSGSVNRTV